MKQYIKITFGLLLSLTLFTSCDNLFEVDPEEALLSGEYLGDNKIDARSALFGVLSQMQDLTTQHIALGEMRADLVDINSNTTDELRQLSIHDIQPNNSYTNPKTLFSIINNCNYALVGIDTKAYEDRLLEDYASILRIRTWAQMQIVLNYGKLPYITKPFRSDDDLNDEFPLYNFNEGIDILIHQLQKIAEIENVSTHGSALGYNIESMIPDNDILLGDLFLWRSDYISAATHYKQFLDKHVLDAGNLYNLTSSYGVNTTEAGGVYSNTNNWGNIFDENSVQSNEVIGFIPFSYQYRQDNVGYSVLTQQMKPSSSIILNWGDQSKGHEGLAYELGDNRASESYTGTGDLAVISKYQYEYFVWNRAAKVYLRYAEAINYAGYPDQALTIMNGIFNNPFLPASQASIFNNVETFLNFELEQYYEVVNDAPVIGAGNLGIRGRASMAPVSIEDDLTESEAIEEVGKLILNEAALELAFEGNRWGDLVRFSKRPGNQNILADAVARKFETAGDVNGSNNIKSFLQNEENWFLPLVLPTNFVAQ